MISRFVLRGLLRPDGFYLVNLWKDRVEFPELKKKCKELYKLYNPNEVLS